MTLENDIVTVELNLEGAPATWFRDKIIHDVRRMTLGASVSSELQKRERDSRNELREKTSFWLNWCQKREEDARSSLRSCKGFDDVVPLLVTVMGAGSAFSLSQQVSSTPFWTVAGFLVSATAVLSTIQSAFKATDKIKEWSDLQGHFVRLRIDLETLGEQMDFQRDFPIADFQQRLETYERRFGDGEIRWRSDLLTRSDRLMRLFGGSGKHQSPVGALTAAG